MQARCGPGRGGGVSAPKNRIHRLGRRMAMRIPEETVIYRSRFGVVIPSTVCGHEMAQGNEWGNRATPIPHFFTISGRTQYNGTRVPVKQILRRRVVPAFCPGCMRNVVFGHICCPFPWFVGWFPSLFQGFLRGGGYSCRFRTGFPSCRDESYRPRLGIRFPESVGGVGHGGCRFKTGFPARPGMAGNGGKSIFFDGMPRGAKITCFFPASIVFMPCMEHFPGHGTVCGTARRGTD